MAKAELKVLCIGASGSIGRYVVSEALRQGHKVRAFTRPRSGADFPSSVEIVVGDLTRPETLAPALESVDAIVFTHGTYGSAAAAEAIDYGGVYNVLTALKGNVRIALMTAISVTDRKGAHDWKRRAERLVRASGHSYTIVRPGWFDSNEPDQLQLVLLQGDRRQSGTPRDGVVARHQIASVLVNALSSPHASRKTFELVAERGPETFNFGSLFASASEDPADALDGILDTPNMPLEREPIEVAAALRHLRPTLSITSGSF